MITQISHKKHATVRPDVSDWCRQQLLPAGDNLILSGITAPLNGLVLCGGRSTRMGIDKGEILYHDAIQREHVYRLLSGLCNEAFLSCNAKQAKEIHHLPIIEDRVEGIGPAGGILSAFAYNPTAAWLTVACDLPYVDEAILRYLAERRNPSKAATAFWDEEDKFPEPLITIWEPEAFPILLRFVIEGFSCPRKMLINSDVEMLKAPDASLLANINTKEEYEEVMQRIKNRKTK